MAGKPRPMSQIKQLLQLHQQGVKKKAIARTLAISKNTVKEYLNKIAIAGWVISDLLSLEDPVLEAMFHAGNPAYSQDRFQALKDELDHYAGELSNKKHRVTKELLWQEYRQQNPDGYSRSQFCFHLLQHIRAKNPSMVLEHKPADQFFFDFAGRYAEYINAETGEIIKCPLFVCCLPYSGYSFVLALDGQDTENSIYALVQAFDFLGGVPKVLVPDNFKAAVTKASRYEPEINRIMEDFANHYGTVIVPARVRKPKDKALVENQVRLTYTHVLAPLRHQQFFSLSDMNAALWHQNLRFNQTRMQKRDYSREEKFVAEEKPLLRSLPAEPFEIKHYRTYTVAKNNFILLGEDNHYYSVPFIHIGQKAKVIYTRSIVQIYCAGKLVAVHGRDRTASKYTFVKDHLCSHHQHYLERSPEYYIGKASKISDALRQLFVLIFSQDKHPEVLYRSCDGLLNICRKSTDIADVEKACQIAIGYGIYTYGFVLNILKNKMFDSDSGSMPPHKPLPSHSNIRGKNHYQQLTLKLNENETNSGTIV
jgi:transposase